jgi:hypothetical protein
MPRALRPTRQNEVATWSVHFAFGLRSSSGAAATGLPADEGR